MNGVGGLKPTLRQQFNLLQGEPYDDVSARLGSAALQSRAELNRLQPAFLPAERFLEKRNGQLTLSLKRGLIEPIEQLE